ncbi:MAG: pantoate--beta-alanine ligase [Pseudonocardiaceae bacterium]
MTDVHSGELTVHHDPAALAAVTHTLRRAGRPVMLVPTMGALHAGHRGLIRAARRTAGASTVVSIFLNPLQFTSRRDFDHYPRQLDEDLTVCREEGVELVFAPSTQVMSPPGSETTVVPGALGHELEGASRPGHFAAVLTVVATLFGIVGPDRAFFGEKDYQQLVLVQRMVTDLRMGVRVVGVPTVREADGLALSSRNVHLDGVARGGGATLSAALRAGARAGAQGSDAVLTAARDVLVTASTSPTAVALDYLVLRDPQLRATPARGPARLLLAATVGTTRLIDNVGLWLGASDVARDANGQGGL